MVSLKVLSMYRWKGGHDKGHCIESLTYSRGYRIARNFRRLKFADRFRENINRENLIPGSQSFVNGITLY